MCCWHFQSIGKWILKRVLMPRKPAKFWGWGGGCFLLVLVFWGGGFFVFFLFVFFVPACSSQAARGRALKGPGLRSHLSAAQAMRPLRPRHTLVECDRRANPRHSWQAPSRWQPLLSSV